MSLGQRLAPLPPCPSVSLASHPSRTHPPRPVRRYRWSGSSWTASDAWWNGEASSIRRFNFDGTSSSERGEGKWQFVPASCGRTGPEGSFIRLSRGGRSFPTHFAARWKNWGWILQNCWGFSASFPLPRRGEEPELEDAGEICQRVTVDSCREEAMLFNSELHMRRDRKTSHPLPSCMS